MSGDGEVPSSSLLREVLEGIPGLRVPDVRAAKRAEGGLMGIVLERELHEREQRAIEHTLRYNDLQASSPQTSFNRGTV